MKRVLLSLLAVCGTAAIALAQPMYPIGATLAYQVSINNGPWQSSVIADYGSRVQFRAVVSYTGTEAAVALGRIYYQPIISNVDNAGTGFSRDNLGTWRNGGSSGQSSATLAAGLLSGSEGASTNVLSSYGRVRYGVSDMSSLTTSGAAFGHRHTGGSSGAPAGSHIRIAGTSASTWYSHTVVNSPLLGMVADNPAPGNTWYLAGTTNMTIFRQELLLSSDVPTASRTLTINSEIGSLARQAFDERHYMTWCRAGESSFGATIRVGVNFVPATIIVRGPGGAIPAPGAAAVFGLATLVVTRRKRER